MTALDWVLLLIVGASALLGLLRGLIGVVVSLVAWLLAGLAAYLFGGDVGQGLATDGQLGWGEYLGGYALSFAVVWIAVALVGLVLRRLAQESDGDVEAAKRLLKEFKGIGNTGADIYLREVQDVWTWAQPYFDKKALGSARKLGLPADPRRLAALTPRSNAQLAAALIRVSLNDDLRKRMTN